MLHVRLGGRQVRAWFIAALIGAVLAALTPSIASASRSDDLEAADALARSGRHEEAARLYESRVKRVFRGVDERVALLAAREYLAAGRLEDSGRMLELVGDRARGDDAVLLARVEAELALAQGRPQAALDAVSRVPEPWPAPLAAELLRLRAQAEFDSGRLLEGLRATEARARYLGTTEERRENYANLLEALAARPAAAAAVPAGASPSERAWFELGALLAAAGDPVARSRGAARWRAQYPGHPGAEFLPAQAAPPAGVAGGVRTVPAGRADAIALLLPLSGRLRDAGRAVRDGFLAAAMSEIPERRPRVTIYDTESLTAAAAYAQAVEAGAGAVAGPLTKEDVASLVAAQPVSVPTLALNALPMERPPPFLFQFALDPEQEARAAARRIGHDGRVRGIALFPGNEWGERVFEAFSDELQSLGIELTSVQFYDPSAKDFSGPLRAALGRYGGAGDRNARGEPVRRDGAAESLDGPQFAFLAAAAPAARALVPQLRFQMAYRVAVYSTSDAVDPGARALPDLDGLQYPEMPWILYGGLGAPELWNVLQGDWAAAARGRLRLYAFGFDAYRLIREMNTAARGLAVGGLSGKLQITPDGRVDRELDWAEVQEGRPQVPNPVLPPATAVEP